METLDNFFVGIKSLNDSETIITNSFDESISGFGKLFTNSYIYNGSIKDGKMNGEGLLIYLNDCLYKSYEGSFIDNKFNGFGKLKYLDGNTFIGNFINNKKHGSGKIYNLNGDMIIENIWENDIINGRMIYTENYHNTNKLKLKGIFNNSIKVGPWIYYRENETIEYIEYYNFDTEKELLLSKLELNNKLIIKKQKIIINSDKELINYNFKYISTFCIKDIDSYQKFSVPINKKNDDLYLDLDKNIVIKFHNNKEYDIVRYLINYLVLIKYDDNMNILTNYIYSRLTKESQLIYSGELNLLNEAHGNGYMYEKNKLKYSGYFEKGFIKKGLLLNDNNILYDGTFKNNIPDGEGILYENGIKVYEGLILNNKKHGEGISYWTNGQIHWHGGWLNDQKHGKGKLYDDTGRLICICTHEFDQLTVIE